MSREVPPSAARYAKALGKERNLAEKTDLHGRPWRSSRACSRSFTQRSIIVTLHLLAYLPQVSPSRKNLMRVL